MPLQCEDSLWNSRSDLHYFYRVVVIITSSKSDTTNPLKPEFTMCTVSGSDVAIKKKKAHTVTVTTHMEEWYLTQSFL